ncbi:DNA repair protein rhp26, partial [Coemansia javaensis]
MAGDDEPGSELRGLSGLGVRVMGQTEMERAVHQQAERDMADQELAVESKRLARADAALARKRAQLARARESAAAARTAARRQKALDRVAELETDEAQLEADRAEIAARMRSAEPSADRAAPAEVKQEPQLPPLLASMVVPRRRAAVAAEQRNRALDRRDRADADGASGSDHGADSDASYHGAASEPEPSADLEPEAGMDSETADSGSGAAAARVAEVAESLSDDIIHDDGDEAAYQERVYSWCAARWRARQTPSSGDDGPDPQREQLLEEPFLADPGTADHAIRAHDRGRPALLVPRQIWDRLLEYQRTGLEWMFALHQQGAGGVLGDEMGLGKTVQVAAFLGSLYHSRLLGRASIIVCPATLMRQWVRELHAWWPVLRVAILHGTGHAMRTAAGTARGLELPHDLAAPLPDGEVDVWEAARAADPRFCGPSAAAADASAHSADGYNSADDYEYDAY